MLTTLLCFVFTSPVVGAPSSASTTPSSTHQEDCETGDLAEALRSGAARFLVLRHEKKGPDRRPGLDPRVSACQKRWRGDRNRDLRVLLQEQGVTDARKTRERLDDLLAPSALAPVVFHSRFCRSLETAIAMSTPAAGTNSDVESSLREIEALDLGSGDLADALAEAGRQTEEVPGPLLLITHKDRFPDLGLPSPHQGGGWALAADLSCLAPIPAVAD